MERLEEAPRPHRFVVDGGEPFVFAGLYERWGSATDAIETCTIVTCAANALCAAVHDRMPVILGDQAIEPWLDGAAADGGRDGSFRSRPPA